MATTRQSPVTARRSLYAWVSSGVLHAALFAVASFGSCPATVAPQSPAAGASVVDVEIPAPTAPARAIAFPKTALPGGGVPSRHDGRSSHASPLPPHVVEGPPAEPVAAQPEPQLAESTDDRGVEVAANAPSDGEPPSASPVPRARRPDPSTMAGLAMAAALATGRGAHGGSGGLGHGALQASLPVVSGEFPLGGDVGDFKAVVCFIRPGTLRIADVHACDPVAVFYTDTFDIPERHYYDGFPGVTGRSSWFMIDYRGSFTVRQDGVYEFRLHSDDGSYLYIDNTLVIENDGKHKPISQWGHIALRPGHHLLKLLYAQTVDRMALQLFVRLPGSSDETLFKSEL
jgi:hypothetical protein